MDTVAHKKKSAREDAVLSITQKARDGKQGMPQQAANKRATMCEENARLSTWQLQIL